MTISQRIQEHEESRLSSAGNKPLDLLMKHHIIKYNHHHGTTCTVSIYLPVKSPAWWINRRRSWRLSKQSWTWPTSGLHSSLTRRGAFTTKNWMSPFFHHFFFWRFKHIFIGLHPAFECYINHWNWWIFHGIIRYLDPWNWRNPRQPCWVQPVLGSTIGSRNIGHTHMLRSG